MLLHVITAALLLNLGTMFSPVPTSDLYSSDSQTIVMEMESEGEIPQACLDQLWEEAAIAWNSTVDILESEYIQGLIIVKEIRTNTYKATRGGDVYISICTDGY